jgi:hypothetical protein
MLKLTLRLFILAVMVACLIVPVSSPNASKAENCIPCSDCYAEATVCHNGCTTSGCHYRCNKDLDICLSLCSDYCS